MGRYRVKTNGIQEAWQQDPRAQIEEIISYRWWFQKIICSSRTLGEWSNFTRIFFQMGWNHRLVSFFQTVDGRNPASVSMIDISLFAGFYTLIFFHQQYHDPSILFSFRSSKWILDWYFTNYWRLFFALNMMTCHRTVSPMLARWDGTWGAESVAEEAPGAGQKAEKVGHTA